jgi:hypothetical protein
VRSIFPAVLGVLILLAGTIPAAGQGSNQSWGNAPVKDQFFTGTVMAVDETSLTVNRTVLGKNSSTRTFLLTAQTKFEGGKPQVRSQVTVRYVTTDDGDIAVRVIVRRTPK